MHDTAAPKLPSFVTLIKNLRDDTTHLIRQEVALAKTEMGEKAGRLGKNAVSIGIGAVTGIIALLFILMGLAELVAFGYEKAGLSEGMAEWLGPLTLGILIAAVAGFLVLKAVKTLSHTSLKPEKTLDTLKQDKDWAIGKSR